MVYNGNINITSYIQAFLTVSHYHKVYIYITVFISDLETEHSKSNVNTGDFLELWNCWNGFNNTVPHDVHKRKELNPNSLQPITDIGGSGMYMELWH